ncbi:putative RasGEF domain containing protein [Blattamonas nauphoetae]|uniref:RasGEF domain containing protein n=1 Tax=Blattamonas nauphoetae TaxID=2049346 RepID=A0ABQ9XHR5_9EUKA|nr:putative RasGEF domain containing protein [Blattamonas nauphoetae]
MMKTTKSESNLRSTIPSKTSFTETDPFLKTHPGRALPTTANLNKRTRRKRPDAPAPLGYFYFESFFLLPSGVPARDFVLLSLGVNLRNRSANLYYQESSPFRRKLPPGSKPTETTFLLYYDLIHRHLNLMILQSYRKFMKPMDLLNIFRDYIFAEHAKELGNPDWSTPVLPFPVLFRNLCLVLFVWVTEFDDIISDDELSQNFMDFVAELRELRKVFNVTHNIAEGTLTEVNKQKPVWLICRLERILNEIEQGFLKRKAGFAFRKEQTHDKNKTTKFEFGTIRAVDDLGTLNIVPGVTLVQQKLIQSMSISEFVGQRWMKEETKRIYSPTICELTEIFNSMTIFVPGTILWLGLVGDSIKKKQEYLCSAWSAWVNIACDMLDAHNFDGTCQIMYGLQHRSITRLVDQDLSDFTACVKKNLRYKHLCNLFMPSGIATLKAEMGDTELPLIPLIPTILRDVVYCEEMRPFWKGEGKKKPKQGEPDEESKEEKRNEDDSNHNPPIDEQTPQENGHHENQRLEEGIQPETEQEQEQTSSEKHADDTATQDSSAQTSSVVIDLTLEPTIDQNERLVDVEHCCELFFVVHDMKTASAAPFKDILPTQSPFSQAISVAEPIHSQLTLPYSSFTLPSEEQLIQASKQLTASTAAPLLTTLTFSTLTAQGGAGAGYSYSGSLLSHDFRKRKRKDRKQMNEAELNKFVGQISNLFGDNEEDDADDFGEKGLIGKNGQMRKIDKFALSRANNPKPKAKQAHSIAVFPVHQRSEFDSDSGDDDDEEEEWEEEEEPTPPPSRP